MLPLCIMEIDEPKDREFVAELYENYSVNLLRMAKKLVGNQDSEDVLCETFLEIIRRVHLLKTLPESA